MKISNDIYYEKGSLDNIPEDISNLEFKENASKKITIDGGSIMECRFEKIDFHNINLLDVDIYDTVFDGCDLSGQKFDKKMLARVVFKDCKLTGASFIDSSLKKVTVKDSIARYINIATSKIDSVSLENSDFSESTFMENEVKNLILDKCLFIRTEFIHNPLKDVDFSTSDIKDTLFDNYSLKGIIIDAFQSPYLVGMLGVKIKDYDN